MRQAPCPDCHGDIDAALDCETCWGSGTVDNPTALQRGRVRLRSTRAGREVRRRRRQVDHARMMWRDRNVQRIAHIVNAHRQILDDEPRLRNVVDGELMLGVSREHTPLGWRRDDLRWALANAARAARGDTMLPLPYVEDVTIEVSEENADFFVRNLVQIRAERTRRPRER